ncbi:hypothetical protein SARC_09820 [Sphaeroforma arctica JP610]|uniref:Uncharacterized protein n=1 Tax=Sphaeroforma arctica JP610 TaxID=667725 RepID=A0A0L0FLS0_9EUKA|nr:hypothetical protein SARC_09820 [Sphaeroforma arctica JP610]KNC77724.1 hypothetical protein SARC_09820 [Sphaeroforma arctica JP610]|eukprot:XP_014151626.1 hypothetical protein SARC_09820 [Sphaeroforma arctica JP610]
MPNHYTSNRNVAATVSRDPFFEADRAARALCHSHKSTEGYKMGHKCVATRNELGPATGSPFGRNVVPEYSVDGWFRFVVAGDSPLFISMYVSINVGMYISMYLRGTTAATRLGTHLKTRDRRLDSLSGMDNIKKRQDTPCI